MDDKTKSSYEKLREASQKLKGEVKEEKMEEKSEPTTKEAMVGPLAVLKQSSEMMKMYGESAKLGSENLSGSLPMLKIHTANKSLKNELVNGGEPHDGWFFLTVNQEEFQNPVCHILSVSRGFRAEGMVDSKTGTKGKDQFNQIMGGVIVDGKNYKPFVMYFTGLKLSRLWEFGKEINKYTNMKPVGIPMFALSVKLSTAKVSHSYGSSYVVDFEVIRDENHLPKLITDQGEFVFLRDMVESVETTIESLISARSTEDNIQTVKSGSDPMIDNQGNVVEDFILDEDGNRMF